MDGGNSTIRKEVSMMGNGRTITCMATENSTTPMANSHMKEIGLSTSSTAKAKSITMHRSQSQATSTTQTSINCKRSGNTMKEPWSQIPKKDKGS